MVNILFSALAAGIVCAVFGLGFMVGKSQNITLPMEKAQEDELKRQQYELDQKAFVECMNYNAENAYGDRG